MAFTRLIIAALAGLGVGNVRSVLRALTKVCGDDKEIIATSDPEVLRRANVLVVPGQGSFGAFARALTEHHLRDVLRERIEAGVPYFGICLGLQILFEESEEAPGEKGLAILPGRVRRLNPGNDLPLPHIGWNNVTSTNAPVADNTHYYFAHTFAAAPSDIAKHTIATAQYGSDTFTCAARRDNVVGVQFHPEKSQRAGLALIQRFFEELV